ncbi:MAG: DUF1501 domain-containing protein [Comamonas sp.]
MQSYPPSTRRRWLQGAGLAAAAALAPAWSFAAAATERRFVFIIQRGAADGLHTVVPYGDPAYAALRRELAVDPAAALKLDGLFALHPALVQLHGMYQQQQALFVHAVASPYRGNRSHFDAQNVLESGGTEPYQVKDGWLNRLAALLPAGLPESLALAPTVPLALRGAVPVASYAPSGLRQPPDDLLARVGQLYEGDAQLHALWASANETRDMAGRNTRQDPASMGRLAAGFLRRADGPRIAMLETNGWDTHAGQAGRMNNQLKNLDTLLAALREGLGPEWERTTVLVATEFGRTAAANGTGGTDHGTGAVALLAGGAVRGGRVLADWPGLQAKDLLEGRDLRPTMALDAVIAAAAGESLGLEPGKVARSLFPAMERSAALPSGLVRA